jgi:hypothetical protein
MYIEVLENESCKTNRHPPPFLPPSLLEEELLALLFVMRFTSGAAFGADPIPLGTNFSKPMQE